MAQIVFGVGASHTPQVSSSGPGWRDHAERDQRNTALLAADGELHTYEDLVAHAPGIEAELSPAVWVEKFDRAQAAIGTLAKRLAEAAPDLGVVVGNDRYELVPQIDSRSTSSTATPRGCSLSWPRSDREEP